MRKYPTLEEIRANDPALEFVKKRVEVMEAHEAKKGGVSPNEPYHPIINPTRTELEERERQWEESAARQRKLKKTRSQGEHWWKAEKLIRAGGIKSLDDLGSRFLWSKWDRERPCLPYGAKWAYHLVKKMISNRTFTEADIERLIPDRSSPFKRSKLNTPSQIR